MRLPPINQWFVRVQMRTWFTVDLNFLKELTENWLHQVDSIELGLNLELLLKILLEVLSHGQKVLSTWNIFVNAAIHSKEHITCN